MADMTSTPSAVLTLHFADEESAQRALREAGFSLGTNQRDDPRGVMFGDVLIAKWRNLTRQEKEILHGVYQRRHMDGPVMVTLSKSCPLKGAGLLAGLADSKS